MWIISLKTHVWLEYSQLEYSQLEYSQLEYSQLEYSQLEYSQQIRPFIFGVIPFMSFLCLTILLFWDVLYPPGLYILPIQKLYPDSLTYLRTISCMQGKFTERMWCWCLEHMAI